MPEIVYWKWSLWLYSVWDNTLKTVLVAAAQQNTPTLEAGGNTLHSSGSSFLPDELYWPDWYCNWPYQYHDWPYRYTDYSTPFVVDQFLSVNAIADTRWVFFDFFFPRNKNWYIFFEPCQVPTVTVSPFIDFSCKDSFFCGLSLKHLSADRLRPFYMVTSLRLVSNILADLLCGKLLTKQKSFLV